MTTVLAAALIIATAASLVLSGLSLVLHKWAPKSKATADVDALRKDLDEVKALLPASPVQAKKPESGRASLTLVALLALAAVAACSLTMSCGASQKAALKNLATCTELAAVKDLTPTVESIIASGVSSWQAQLEALGKSFGMDELACAVTAAQQFFASPAGTAKMAAMLAAEGSGKVSAESAQEAAAGAVQRASQWLTEHGYK
jgi:hypothetical protein